jgi:hypothetical protein
MSSGTGLKTMAMKNGEYRVWTQGDLDRLREMLDADAKVADIAKEMGRTSDPVYMYMHKNGIVRGGHSMPRKVGVATASAATLRNGKRPWTAADDIALKALLAEDMSIDDIAEALHRTPAAVRSHCSLQGLSTRPKAQPRPEPTPTPRFDADDPFRGSDRREWTNDEIELLVALRKTDLALPEIAFRLRRSQASTQTQISRMHLPTKMRGPRARTLNRLADENAKVNLKPCMCCRKTINSTWIGHRLCDDCREAA